MVFVSREVWCLRDRAVWWCGRVDVVCTLYFTFLGRVVRGTVMWGRVGFGWKRLSVVFVGCDMEG